mmetsp:Transcript_34001/g.66408  ORF Transcript_34001/g.66408 Transcript_34001/m.66408 type:complete len:120 (-) Transcript_34001:253-612(-)|eukprot:CAMPEP_0173396700 /NCGR_PEP_ID=MMETSP1356-20130122/36271_1 /TAXON_ID=77927 ORGANISM="Hemiselmis virescens, Strain PCC157" /NCGR_SAMPLE_ID=MMETSP1356 /ASSEMBLY_ACC=CAM_ASM_000847 /LENGTH=119 /DNA_ID=CAMNT_0014355787 /DNA_START=228 /DNA_END=587 /DNA_ORIENTATION=+
MAEKTYQIQPQHKKKFKPQLVEKVIKECLAEKLQGEKYHVDKAARFAREITDTIKTKLKEMNWDRYKYVVQCVIGEQRGEGVKMGSRCYWDEQTDNSASATFSNDSLFCACVAFGVYLY